MAFHFVIEKPSRPDAPVIVRLTGRLTLGPRLIDFGRRLADLVVSQHSPGFLLDVAAIEDVDSAGLGELVILYTTAGQHGQRLCLVNASPRLIHLLETTKLTGILPNFAGETAAQSWIRTPPPLAPGPMR